MKNVILFVIGVLLLDIGLNTDSLGNGILGSVLGALIYPDAMVSNSDAIGPF